MATDSQRRLQSLPQRKDHWKHCSAGIADRLTALFRISQTPLAISASASSGLPVSFASTTMPVCTVSGTTVTIATVGTCSITATQPGNAAYAAAAPVIRSFTISQATQAITFNALGNVSFGATPFTISATSSGLPVSLASTTLPVCIVTGTTVTIVAAAVCSITASQPGNANYAAATPVVQVSP